jgi:hypothetical protein
VPRSSQSYRDERVFEKLRYIHRNPVVRGLAANPEDWPRSSFRHYQSSLRGTIEIESEWTARERGWQLTEWVRNRQSEVSTSPVPKGGDRAHPQLDPDQWRPGPPAWTSASP